MVDFDTQSRKQRYVPVADAYEISVKFPDPRALRMPLEWHLRSETRGLYQWGTLPAGTLVRGVEIVDLRRGVVSIGLTCREPDEDTWSWVSTDAPISEVAKSLGVPPEIFEYQREKEPCLKEDSHGFEH